MAPLDLGSRSSTLLVSSRAFPSKSTLPRCHKAQTCLRGRQNCNLGKYAAVKASKEDPDAQGGSLQTAPAVPAADSDSKPSKSGRLFSNIDPSELTHRPGTVFASATLVAGTTVGAGILALPYSTQVSIKYPRHDHAVKCVFPSCTFVQVHASQEISMLKDCWLMQSRTHAPDTAAFSDL